MGPLDFRGLIIKMDSKAPIRHPIPWKDPSFYDEEDLDQEMRRVFDICHGCRRCFNLCDSFPRLFDLVDQSSSEELDTVDSQDFKSVVDACTLCDLCFMAKCPYVPPHEFNIDFPHLMLRYRAVEAKKGALSWRQKELTNVERNDRLLSYAPKLANWVMDEENKVMRPFLEKTMRIDRRAELPKYEAETLISWGKKELPPVNQGAPALGRKAVLYATCFGNYHNTRIGKATAQVLSHNGVSLEIVYPGCCGMPKLEQGDLDQVSKQAVRIARDLRSWVDKGYAIVTLVPSCALMLKSEWPLLLPENEDIQVVSESTFDISQYVIDISQKEGLVPGLKSINESVFLHVACHARAQNIGNKAHEMLKLIPVSNSDENFLTVMERCSGHGGSWGVMKDNFEIALKVGKPVIQKAIQSKASIVASECPLAVTHIKQGMDFLSSSKEGESPFSRHPIEILAQAYGLNP